MLIKHMVHCLYLLMHLQYPARCYHFFKVLSHKDHLEVNVVSHFTVMCAYIPASLSKPFQNIHHYRIVLVSVNQKLQQQLTSSALINGSSRKF